MHSCELPKRSTLIGSAVQDVVFPVPSFPKALLRNIPYRYVFLEKISAGMKFRNWKEFWYGVAAYTGSYQALCTARGNGGLYKQSSYTFLHLLLSLKSSEQFLQIEG
jgi:hypothetical protein